MSDDLVKRLRDSCQCNIDSTPCGAEDECRAALEAADRIEALERVFALVVADIEGQWAVPAPKQPACLCPYTVDAIRALKGNAALKATAAAEFVTFAGGVDRLIANTRNEALEEAARVARGYSASDVHPPVDEVSYGLGRAAAAAAIRALKEKE